MIRGFKAAVGVLLYALGSTAVVWAAPTLSLGSGSGSAGSDVVLQLSLSGGTEPYAGVNARFTLPENITITSVQKGDLTLGNFTADFFQANGSNTASVIVYSGTSTFATSSGTLLNITLRIGANAASGGPTSIPIVTSGLSNASGSASLSHTKVNGAITVGTGVDSDTDGLSDSWEQQYFPGVPVNTINPGDDADGDGLTNKQEFDQGFNPTLFVGDVSGDKALSGADATRVLQSLAGLRTFTSQEVARADTSNDGSISGADATRILQVLAGLRNLASIQR